MPSSFSSAIDPNRIVCLRQGSPRTSGRYVLYFCQIARRAEQNPALDYAIAWANHLRLPVVVYEGLRPDYPHASARHHRFILDGVRDFALRLATRGIAHVFYLPKRGERFAMLAALADQAALVVTDDHPTFVVPRHNRKLAQTLDCPLYAIDGCDVVPLRTFSRAFPTAAALRPHLHRLWPKLLAETLDEPQPIHDSLSLFLPALPGLVRGVDVSDVPADLDRQIVETGVDSSVAAVAFVRGGRTAGLLRLQRFLQHGLPHYAEGRNLAGQDVTSGMSPYLHYGMLSAGEVARAVIAAHPQGLAHPPVAAYIEELLVRRHLAHNFCLHAADPTQLAALPVWAQTSLREHGDDVRKVRYDRETLLRARTHDPLWNAIQTELRELGEPHGYLRMLWGKRVIEWAPSYKEALSFLIECNDRFAYDGRDPNGYTGILWCFGLHDRPFARRPVFGLLRPMSSDGAGKRAQGPVYIERVRRTLAGQSASGLSTQLGLRLGV
ncbi:MAG TPA: deoxyribodipyrimidine photo-lyase [Pseudomonadota bacterium]|nr:deoxyribodipyrimidine photo-lyase [Pseudomonadota bacterium]HNI58866.1 deoxyribodipyrimidine photo-lyase [Pseudomonadota bacterium]